MLPELKTLKIGEPAQSALRHAGILSVQQLSEITKSELLALHGVGPKAVRILEDVLNKAGLSFKMK